MFNNQCLRIGKRVPERRVTHKIFNKWKYKSLNYTLFKKQRFTARDVYKRNG